MSRPVEHTAGPPISAIVLTLNEAQHIVPCLRALQWADETLVVDSGSVDGTPALARGMGARVLAHPWPGWAAQRNWAAGQARHDWVFFVDADERVTPELAGECRRRVAAAGHERPPVAGFWVPRQNLILGHWVQHAGWGPDYQLRLFRRDRGGYDPQRPVHEIVRIDGPAARLDARLVHHNYAGWRQFWAKQCRYACLEAAVMHAQGIRPRPHNFVLQPLREFCRRYWELAGYREGVMGVALCALLAAAHLLLYIELSRLWRQGPAATTSTGPAGDPVTPSTEASEPPPC